MSSIKKTISFSKEVEFFGFMLIVERPGKQDALNRCEVINDIYPVK